MRFRRDATLDPRQVEDVRGSGGLGVPTGAMLGGGGGGGGIIVFVVAMLLRGGSGGGGLGSVRLELQADCYAGVWAKRAADTRYIDSVTRADINGALDAASSVGDDRLQQRAGGGVNPDSFTHGTSAQRQRWFTRGYETGQRRECDTLSASTL